VITLVPEKLTAENFAPYGEVIEIGHAREVRRINYGHTERYHDIARLDLAEAGGMPLVNIFRSKPLPRPIEIKVMERHPLSSQAFYPLNQHHYMVVVAPAGDFDPGKLKAFIASATQGVNYARGTWHHYSLALDHVSDFLVIDRGGPEQNCDEVFLEGAEIRRIDY